jgi:alanine or glycine:cation symporter, AGCS family
MLGTFIDTLIVCTMTGLAIVCTGVWTSGAKGASLSAAAFEQAMPGFGSYILSISLVIFAFTTILGWSYYGEKCWIYLLGKKTVIPYRILWVAAVMVGAIAKFEFVWLMADVLNGLMAIPNLISLLLLSSVVVKLTRDYFAKEAKS